MAKKGTDSYKWEEFKCMPTPRVFATAVAKNDDNVYVIGGCDQRGQPLDSFEHFDPKKRKWNRLKQMNVKRAGVAAAVIGDKIVAIGGVGSSQEPQSTVEVFDTTTSDWTLVDALPEGLLGLGIVVKDDKVLVIGGMAKDTNPRDSVMSYDVSTNKWKALKPMPTPRYACFPFLVGNKLYVLGGRQGKIPCAAFEVYDFDEDKWEKLTDIPSKRVFALYAASDTHIFSMGGLRQPASDGFSDACEVFDIATKNWKLDCEPLPTRRGDFAIGIVGSKVICAGGLGNDGKPLDVVEAYDQSTDTWIKLKSMHSSHCSCAYTVMNGKLYVAGGLSVEGPSACMEAVEAV
ncbi:hypothetical protein ScPMuIL_009129 [Solemya velum]